VDLCLRNELGAQQGDTSWQLGRAVEEQCCGIWKVALILFAFESGAWTFPAWPDRPPIVYTLQYSIYIILHVGGSGPAIKFTED
jgi:hypothetical protein